MKVPFLDLRAQFESIREPIVEAIQEVLDRTAFAGGPIVERFEEEFAEFCGAKHVVACNSGTTALWMTLLAMGVRDGEVITVPNTFIATAEAISFCGARPVFVDVDPLTLTMDPDRLEVAITPQTRAIVPVHLYGQMADLERIRPIAERHGIPIIEDAAQAHGASLNGSPPGAQSHGACFSFYPGKNLGAYGEGGAVVTNDDDLALTMRWFRDHGQSGKHHHQIIGWNGRMDGFQAAVLRVKLQHLSVWTHQRRVHAKMYSGLLGDVNAIRPPVQREGAYHVYHLYVIRTAEREQLIEALNAHEIGHAIHYPVPIHLQPAYTHLRLGAGCFPVAEQCAKEILSLPMYSELHPDRIEQVVDALHAFQETTA